MRVIRYAGAIMLIMVAIIATVAFTQQSNAQSLKFHPRATPSLNQQQRPVGFPAITPHIHPLNQTAITFNTDDVELYVTQHGSPAGPLVKGKRLGFVKVLFVSAKEAKSLMYGEATGLPDNATVCYVLIRGPFILTGMHAAPGVRMPKYAAETELVFDGHTGNFLMWGVPARDFIWS